jgi:hypothetical protein
VRTGQSWRFNVTQHNEALSKSHTVSGLAECSMSIEPYIVSLFDGRHVLVRPPASRAAQFVMRRCRVTPDVANVVAALAGLGSEVRS